MNGSNKDPDTKKPNTLSKSDQNNTFTNPVRSTATTPTVRKLPESRKLPFLVNNSNDTSSATTSKLINKPVVSSKPPPVTRKSNYAFNFDAIKSRFAENTTNNVVPKNKRGLEEVDNKNEISQNKRMANERSDAPDKKAIKHNEKRDDNFTRVPVSDNQEKSIDIDEKTEDIKVTSEPVSQFKVVETIENTEGKQSQLQNSNQNDITISSIEESTSMRTFKKPDVPQTHLDEVDDVDSDIDLSDIGLHQSFVDKCEKEKAKKEQEDAQVEAKEENKDNSNKKEEKMNENDATKSSSQEESISIPFEAQTNSNSPEYWKNLTNTDLYRTKSLKFKDIINKEFGYAGRMGHGNRNNFFGLKSFKKPMLIYDQQLQSPKDFVKKAMSSLSLIRRMKQAQSLVGHDGCVNALNYNGSGSLLLSGSDDYHVCVWDWPRKNVLLSFDSGHRSNIFQTKFVPFSGDTQIVTSARDGQVRLALISTSGTHLGTKRLAKHSDSCHKLSIEKDSSNLFLSCGEDGVVYEIDLRQDSPAKILSIKNHNRNYKLPLYSIHSNPSDTYQFVVAGRDPYIRIYDKRMLVSDKNSVLKMFCPDHLKDSQRSSITSAVYNHNGTEIVASYSDDNIYLYGTDQEAMSPAMYRYKGHRNSDTVKEVKYFGANSDYIVSGSDCGRIFFWEKTTQQIVQLLKTEENGIVNVLEAHPSFPILATSGLEADIKIWSPTAEEETSLENLEEIVQDNQRIRETSRHFSLSSFEFELLMLLMNRRNSQENETTPNQNNAVIQGVNVPFDIRNRLGARMPGYIPEGTREFSPVDDDDEENFINEEEDEEESYMNFEEEDSNEEDASDSVHLANYLNRRRLLEDTISTQTAEIIRNYRSNPSNYYGDSSSGSNQQRENNNNDNE